MSANQVKIDSTDNLALFKNDETKKNVIKLTPGNDEQAIALWNSCLNLIKDNISPRAFETWFSPSVADTLVGDVLTIKVPSQFYREWIETNYSELVRASLNAFLGEQSQLIYKVVVENSSNRNETSSITIPAVKTATKPIVKPEIQKIPHGLHQRYIFENFVCGESNQLAYSAAKAVAQNPGGTKFNPLFIYGETGLGKTHLAQAIGNHIIRTNERLRVLYTNSERFTMDFISAIQTNSVSDFINLYRSIDVLIVDDIQFLAGKEKTQDNFFHTFNALHQSGKQIILTSDRSPKELKDLDDRLISRFQWGLTVDVQKPDLETRMAILQKKSADEGISLAPSIIEHIATNITSSIRELEGALINLLAKVTLDNRPLSLSLAQEVIQGTNSRTVKDVTVDLIKEKVSDYYDIEIETIVSNSRKHQIALARQMCMYLAKKFTNLSLKNIGAEFGNRDHSTVLHSCNAIENYLATDKKVKAQFVMFEEMLINITKK